MVGKFVEFYGPGLDEMSLEDRATIANMAPEYGATCGFFPIDAETVRYLKNTARKPAARGAGGKICQGARPLSHRQERPIRSSPTRWRSIMTTVEPSLAGPMRPQDRVPLSRCGAGFRRGALINTYKKEDDANKPRAGWKAPNPPSAMAMW